MSYRPATTAAKTAPPFVVIALVNVILWYCKSKGIDIDEATIWTAAAAGLGVLTGFFNWLKHRKR